jgi:hypothetical protein
MQISKSLASINLEGAGRKPTKRLPWNTIRKTAKDTPSLFNRACSSEESERERAEERKQIEKDKLAITPQHCALAAVVERVSAPLKKLTCSLLFSS